MPKVIKDHFYHGDNVKIMQQWPADCIDLIVTSPPYDGVRTFDDAAWDFKALARECFRVLKIVVHDVQNILCHLCIFDPGPFLTKIDYTI